VALGFALQLVTLGLGGFGRPGPALAEEEEVLPSRQVVIIMRALAYDENLKIRAGTTINLGILYKKGHARSERMASTMAKAFGALASTQVAGLPITVSRVAYGSAEGLAKALGAAGIDTLYACEGLESEVRAITEVSRKARTLTVGSSQEQVRQGLSLGVFQIEGKTTILLNLPASRQEGAAFAPDLLRLATVIR